MNKGRTHKQLKQDYKTSPPPMGVFLIRNMVNDRVFVGIGLNLAGIINRNKFELAAGSHHSKQLQKDWNELGADNFAFEIVDQLDPLASPDRDPREDLQSLEDLWLERLRPYGDRGYNEPKLSREEKLRLIAANRRGEF